MPGFDYKFLEKPKRRFQCPLCSKAMREPVQVSTCGHRFCDTCLQEFLRTLKQYTESPNSLPADHTHLHQELLLQPDWLQCHHVK
uniref:RING-type domain-containing protein n=1 Tax=Astatotilapia calliptera TaxID=8154 RepID=A0AAX7SU38_ASTCA